jgi:hypothetical protein
MEPETFKPFELAKDMKLESGQALDFGTVDVNTGKQVKVAPPQKAAGADAPITGRIVNLEGQPIPGVAVKVTSVLFAKSDDLTPWLDVVRKGEPPWVASQHLDGERKAPERVIGQVMTDKDGRFRLDGFGPDQLVGLELQGGTIAYTTIDVATRKMDPIPARGFSNDHGPGHETIYGSDFTYTAAPSRLIEGSVKDAQTGQGLTDVEIRSYRFAGTNVVGAMTLKTKTDAKGRFRLSGMPKGKGNVLIIVPNDDQPYFMQEIKVPNPPGADAVSVELALKRGIWIEGRVTDKATGTAVPHARLHYFPFLANKYAQAHPVFYKNGFTEGVGFQHRYETKADGTFRLVGLPGRAIVGALAGENHYLQGAGSEAIKGMNKAGHFETYRNPINPSKVWPNVMKEIDPSADVSVVHVDLQFATGPSLRVTVVDDDGQPIAGLKTNGRLGRSSYDHEDTTKPETEVTNLMPDEERTVLLRHEGRKLGKVVRIKQGDDKKGPVIVKLAPLATITGRVTDADGNPVFGAVIQPDVLPAGDFALRLSQTATDSDGRFRVVDVPTGCEYELRVETRAPRQFQFAYHDKTAVKPGETTDVGEIKFKRD